MSAFSSKKLKPPYDLENFGALYFVNGEIVPGPYRIEDYSMVLKKISTLRAKKKFECQRNYDPNTIFSCSLPEEFKEQSSNRFIHKLCFDGEHFGIWSIIQHTLHEYDLDALWINIPQTVFEDPKLFAQYLEDELDNKSLKAYQGYKENVRHFGDSRWYGFHYRSFNHIDRLCDEINLFKTQLMLLGYDFSVAD